MKVIVIGGGPAGIMAALTAKRNGNEVIIFEKMRSIGRKLSITGKGRCNITNMAEMDEFINNIPGNGKFLYSSFNKFNNNDLLSFIHSLGIETKVERGMRVFPISDDALQIVDGLKKELDKEEVKLFVNSEVEQIIVKDRSVESVKVNGKIYKCDKVIIATGGKSYPLTGSTGDGYKFARELGHTIASPKGSLVPMETYESAEALQGLSLKNVRVKFKDNDKIIYEDFGEMIFTHYGVSGPVILSGSSHILRVKDIENKMKNKNITLHIDLKPALSEEKLDERLKRDFEKYSKKQFKNCLGDLLPSKMIPYVVSLSKIDEDKQIDQLTKEERKILIGILKDLKFTIKFFRPIEEAIVTAGGVSIKEINSSTMESKLISGLYFAGEVIDVDAYTGGFNLQIAFSTGYVAGLTM